MLVADNPDFDTENDEWNGIVSAQGKQVHAIEAFQARQTILWQKWQLNKLLDAGIALFRHTAILSP